MTDQPNNMTADYIAPALRQLAVPIDSVESHPENPKIGDVSAIAESLQRFGQVRTILVQDSTGYVVAGNHTRKAAQALGWGFIAVARVDLSDDEALAYMLADNRLAELGKYDNEVLAELTARALGAGGLAGTGYDEDDVLDGFANVVQTERVPIADLRPHPRNYKEHPPEQLAQLERSLEDNGFYRDVVVANDGTILAGHGVVEAAKARGQRKVPVKRMPFGPDDDRAITIVTGDNELGKLAGRNDRALTDMLKEMADRGHDLQATGFDAAMLANLRFVTTTEDETPTVDAAAEWVGMPEFTPMQQRITLVLAFDSEEKRGELIDQLGLIIAKKTKQTWSAWWPPRELEDLSSLRFERDGEPDADAEPSSEAAAEAVEAPAFDGVAEVPDTVAADGRPELVADGGEALVHDEPETSPAVAEIPADAVATSEPERPGDDPTVDDTRPPEVDPAIVAENEAKVAAHPTVESVERELVGAEPSDGLRELVSTPEVDAEVLAAGDPVPVASARVDELSAALGGDSVADRDATVQQPNVQPPIADQDASNAEAAARLDEAAERLRGSAPQIDPSSAGPPPTTGASDEVQGVQPQPPTEPPNYRHPGGLFDSTDTRKPGGPVGGAIGEPDLDPSA